MVYDKTSRCYGDGQWHCPFTKEWVERMSRAAKICQGLSAVYIESFNDREEDFVSYRVPAGDFLSVTQEANGLPFWMCNHSRPRVSCDVYDYDSIPDVVISNGHDDWPLVRWESVLRA